MYQTWYFFIRGDDQIQLNVPKQRSNLSNCWCTDSSDRMDLLDSAYNRRHPRFILDSQPCFLFECLIRLIHCMLSSHKWYFKWNLYCSAGYTFEPNEALPVWFLEDEDKYNKYLGPKKVVSCIVPSGCLLDEARIAHQQGANESVGKPGMKQLFPYPTKTWWHLIITGSARDSPRSAEGRGSQVGF